MGSESVHRSEGLGRLENDADSCLHVHHWPERTVGSLDFALRFAIWRGPRYLSLVAFFPFHCTYATKQVK